jgi:hypothetical protein
MLHVDQAFKYQPLSLLTPPTYPLPTVPPRAMRRGLWTYNDVILVLRVNWLIMRRYVNLIVWQLVFAEVFKEICVSWAVEVNVGI